ncbi:MAG: hypothetical protein ACR2PT_20160, partial [Endozoicomonas sp.]
TGKSDFDAIENLRHDAWFKRCMGIRQMPSASRLRQRFDEDACVLMPLINDSLAEVVVNLNAPSQPCPPVWTSTSIFHWTLMFSPWTTVVQKRKASPTPTKVMMAMRLLPLI